MCNYEMDLALLTNGVQLKACDFEAADIAETKGTCKVTDRAARRKATIKAKRRKADVMQLRKAKQFKAERDGEMMYFLRNGRIEEIHDSKLWKPIAKK